MLCKVFVKVGSIGRTSRTSLRVPNDLCEVSIDGTFGNLHAAVEERVTAAMGAYDSATERVDGSMYLKPNVTAAQKDLLVLEPENFRERMLAAKRSFDRRKKVSGPFVVEIYVFIVRKTTVLGASIRRATASRVATAATAVSEYLAVNPAVQVGEIARTHWEFTHARQLDDAPVQVPDSATFRQIQHIDSMRAAQEESAPVPSLMQTITVHLNGSSDLAICNYRSTCVS